MIWLWVVGAALLIFAAMWWLGKLPGGARPLVGAALMLGLAGYAVTGVPGQQGTLVKRAANNAGFGEPIAANQGELRERFGEAGQWLGMADAMQRRGKPDLAIKALKGGLEKYPDNVDLWVALANALVEHGGQMMNPAAALAFDEAAKRSPNHPAPPFFAGLAMARGGDLAGAEAVWAQLLARSPADAPWRADLEERLAQLRAMKAQLGGAAPPPR
jgi:cytochrome c-type biogenesis protein CcmH